MTQRAPVLSHLDNDHGWHSLVLRNAKVLICCPNMSLRESRMCKCLKFLCNPSQYQSKHLFLQHLWISLCLAHCLNDDNQKNCSLYIPVCFCRHRPIPLHTAPTELSYSYVLSFAFNQTNAQTFPTVRIAHSYMQWVQKSWRKGGAVNHILLPFKF